MTMRDKGSSNIIILDHEVALDEWLKEHGATILVRKMANGSWASALEGPLAVETAGPCASAGTTPFEAVRALATWMTGARFSRTGPLGYVPTFSQNSIARAVSAAYHTDPTRNAQ